MPAVVPFIPAIIGAAGSIGGGLLAKRRSQQEQDALAAQTGAFRAQSNVGQEVLPYARQALLQGESTYSPAIAYWQRLLGDRQTAMEGIAPEADAVRRLYGGAFQASSELQPRGGMTVTQRGELPFDQAREISQLLFRARPEAARNLFMAGGDLARLGMSGYGTATGAYSAAGGAAGDLMRLEMARRGQTAETAGGVGRFAYELAKSIPWGTIFKPKVAGGSVAYGVGGRR